MRRPAVRARLAAVAVTLGCLAAVAGTTAVAGTAHADTYRYWSYWHADGGSWTYATTGPATYRPDDGAVEGWRFTAAAEARAARPRTTPAFDRICAGIRIKAGHKRVGLVLDHGTAEDAPDGARPPRAEPTTRCAVVPDDATGADVLAEAGRVRYATSGLVCAVGGYPARGCGDAVGGASSAASGSSTAAGSTPSGTRSSAAGSDGDGNAGATTAVAVGVGVAIIAALVGATAVRRRRENG